MPHRLDTCNLKQQRITVQAEAPRDAMGENTMKAKALNGPTAESPTDQFVSVLTPLLGTPRKRVKCHWWTKMRRFVK